MVGPPTSMFSTTSSSLTPRRAATRAKSTRPRLSKTDRRARSTRTSPGAVRCIVSERLSGIDLHSLLDQDQSGVSLVEPDAAARHQADRPWQQLVLGVMQDFKHLFL